MVAAARVAVVTGANKGVGYHIAQSLVHSGLFSVVVLGCRDPTRGQHAAAEIGGCSEYMPLEVGNAASADAFAEALVARHGRCDVLVNNAGNACLVSGGVGVGVGAGVGVAHYRLLLPTQASPSRTRTQRRLRSRPSRRSTSTTEARSR